MDANTHIIYINKEDLAFSHTTTAKNLNNFVQEHKKSSQKNYIFIDEIQEIATSSTQVQNYAEYLANTFLVHKVPRCDIEGKRIFGIGGLNSQEIDFLAEKK